MPGLRIEPRAHWWEASALTTVPSLHPTAKLSKKTNYCFVLVRAQLLIIFVFSNDSQDIRTAAIRTLTALVHMECSPRYWWKEMKKNKHFYWWHHICQKWRLFTHLFWLPCFENKWKTMISEWKLSFLWENIWDKPTWLPFLCFVIQIKLPYHCHRHVLDEHHLWWWEGCYNQ